MTSCVSPRLDRGLPAELPCARLTPSESVGRSVTGGPRRLRPECAAGSDQIAGRALAMARHPSWDGEIASYILLAQSGGRRELLEDALDIVRPDPSHDLDVVRTRAVSSIGRAMVDLGAAPSDVDIDLTERGGTVVA
jgi:hypothetical protein